MRPFMISHIYNGNFQRVYGMIRHLVARNVSTLPFYQLPTLVDRLTCNKIIVVQLILVHLSVGILAQNVVLAALF